jgi:V/A-type H+/Na+-transporting ATPase subunit E
MAVENITKAVGVDELIDRLKTDGVVKGKSEAEAIVADAKRQAMAILDTARNEADSIVTAAKAEADRICQTSNQALKLAGRDALLKLRESFTLQFENRIRKLVEAELKDPKILGKMILEVAGKSRPSESTAKMEILLPMDAPETDPLISYVAGVTESMLRQGVTFGVGDDVAAGVKVRLADKDVDIDMSDEALSAFLARFLVPRFRHIMDFKS